MSALKKWGCCLHLAAAAVPFALSLSAALMRSLLLGALAVLSLFLAVRLLPACRHRENLWMFLLAALAGIPINLTASAVLLRTFFSSQEWGIARFLWGILLYAILFSTEQIILGVITRLLWKAQYPIQF